MNDYLDTVGRIFDIQRFSVHDGPGVRTIVFLKGCVLRCKWCCNPESQHYNVENLISGGKTKVVGEDVTARKVLETVERDRVYYKRSGGGLTLSGGESFCQPEFALALFKGAKEIGINTAIETTSCAPFETIEKILPYIDYYLMDIKHVNPQKHKEFTGRDNALILENAGKIAQRANDMVIRVPVIPTFNDTPEEIAEIAKFTSTLENVKKIHLLPYHRLGQDKYAGLGREYLMAHITPPTDEKMETLKKVAEQFGLICEIGG